MTVPRKLQVNIRKFRPGTLHAYILTVLLVAMATAVRVALGLDAPRGQFILIFLPIIATTYICGMTMGFLSIVISTVCAWVFPLPPVFAFQIGQLQSVWVLVAFALFASVIAVTTGLMRSAIERVRRLHQTLATVFESNPDGILLIDPRGHITDANRRASELFGKSRDTLVGASINTLLPERFHICQASLAATYLASPQPRQLGVTRDLFALHGDGTEFPVDIQIGPIEIDGETRGIVTARDLTEHNALHKALAESRQRQAVAEARQAGNRALCIALESTTDSVVVCDRAWRFTYMNQRAKALNPHGPDLVGQVVWDVFPWLQDSPVGQSWRSAMQTGTSAQADDYFAQWETHFEAHAYPSADGLSVFLRNVTEERRSEAARAESEALLEVARASAAHAERVQALGQLAGGIAHDFNNVLQMIEGVATLIERRPGDAPAVARLAHLAMEAAGRGASITRRLLAFGRRGDLRAEALDMASLLGGLNEIFSRTLGASIDIRIEVAADLPPPFADKAQLETVLVNLATNARDAMPHGGRLTLSAVSDVVAAKSPGHPAELVPGRYVRLSVTDNGTGMDPKTLAHAHEPFFTTKAMGAGTGLGLPMAKGFAEQSGGALSVESHLGHGTTVTLWLPEMRSDSAATVHGAGDRLIVKPEAGRDTDRSCRLLVVDDEDALREVIAQNLQDRGFDVLAVASGAEALAVLASQTPLDAMVTDLSMPGMDGIALIRAVQARRPGLPAVLLTGYAGDESALRMGGIINGTYSLARKPIATNDLVDRIEALLAAHSSPLPETLRADA